MERSRKLASLRAKIRALEDQAAELERASKPGIVQAQLLIAKYKLTAEDVELALKLAVPIKKRGVPKGTRLKVKYRNPHNPRETWAGRGLKPRWVTALLRQGKTLDDLVA